jgi:hypothetical protein
LPDDVEGGFPQEKRGHLQRGAALTFAVHAIKVAGRQMCLDEIGLGVVAAFLETE